jgi:hypothetical protein
MDTALKTVTNDGRPSGTRLVVLWILVFAVVCGMIVLFLSALLDVGTAGRGAARRREHATAARGASGDLLAPVGKSEGLHQQ